MNEIMVSIPDAHRPFIEAQIATGRFQTPSEVVSDAMRQAEILEAKRKLEALLEEGLQSGEPIVATKDWWGKRREELLARIPREQSE